jgi:DNA polymerase, archaea type
MNQQQPPERPDEAARRRLEHEWLWGWDSTPGIVSVWAEPDGRAHVWRRLPGTGELVREEERFRPWLLLDRLDDLRHLEHRLQPDAGAEAQPWPPAPAPSGQPPVVTFRELDGPGALRFLVSAADGRALASAVLRGASKRLGRSLRGVRDIGRESVLALPPDEQYLVATGRTYFRDLSFDDLHRLQFDLETTGLDPTRDRMFMAAVRDSKGEVLILEAGGEGDSAEADLVRRLVAAIRADDPDVIENHNLHGFDLPFLERRAQILGVPLPLGRVGPAGLRRRGARRGTATGEGDVNRVRFVAPGRELIDTLDAVLRFDFATRELPGHGLKAVARHLGLAGPDRELIPGDQVYDVFKRDPARVRRYAGADVEEVAGVAKVLGGAAFALARMAPRRYERLADAGAATGVVDPLLVRAYLRAGAALPSHQEGDGTTHTGAALYLFATGVATRVVKADVASLYPSLMRSFRIGPARDHLGAMLALVDGLVECRLAAKASGRAAPPGSAERFTHEAMSAAMKLVVNSAYGYLAAGGGLTRFADVHAANEVTRRGRQTLDLLCRELGARGVTLLEADTDGVYFAVPEAWTEPDERRVVAEVGALLPDLVRLEFDGRYAAMLSHEPKNYALLAYDGTLLLRGVAFRSSRAEPFGEEFLRRATFSLLSGDTPAVREAYLATADALRRREFTAYDVSSRVRLTKSPDEYRETREQRKEAPYEAMLASGRTSWHVGERVRVYRTTMGGASLVPGDEVEPAADARRSGRRDYDVDYYLHQLRHTFAARLERAFTESDAAAVFADSEQLSLFAPEISAIRAVLRPFQ